jgi:hypothetical protein
MCARLGAGLDLPALGSSPGDLLDDLLNRCRPDEGLGIFFASFEELVDRTRQTRHAHEAAAPHRLVRQFSVPALHQIPPRLHVRLFMHAEIVHDQAQLQARGKSRISPAQKQQPILMTMPGATFPDQLAVHDVQGREQRRGERTLTAKAAFAQPATA